SANGSTDPDGNSLSYKWYQYPSAAGIALTGGNSANVRFTAPRTPGARIEVVLEVTDNGSPSLTSYRRVVVTVR
ncbi:PKD domain-containing protein, partial [Streptomyces heilongjiangensis]